MSTPAQPSPAIDLSQVTALRIVPPNAPNPECLLTKCREVETGADVKFLCNEMRYTLLRSKNGVGLAANQIGVLLRVILIVAGAMPVIIINPVITKRWGGKQTKPEGCLSYPGRFKKASRYKRITVTGFDEYWNPVEYNLCNFKARIVQHEIDHLDGKAFF